MDLLSVDGDFAVGSVEHAVESKLGAIDGDVAVFRHHDCLLLYGFIGGDIQENIPGSGQIAFAVQRTLIKGQISLRINRTVRQINCATVIAALNRKHIVGAGIDQIHEVGNIAIPIHQISCNLRLLAGVRKIGFSVHTAADLNLIFIQKDILCRMKNHLGIPEGVFLIVHIQRHRGHDDGTQEGYAKQCGNQLFPDATH